MGFSLKKFLKNPIKETFNTMAKLPGSPEALLTGLYKGVKGEASWNPYKKGQASVWDIGAGGTELSKNEKLRDVGRAAGTLVGGYFAAGALAGGAPEAAAATTAAETATGEAAWTAATDAALAGNTALTAGSTSAAADAAAASALSQAGTSAASTAGAGGSSLWTGAKSVATKVLGNGYGNTLLGLVGAGVTNASAERAAEKVAEAQAEKEAATRRRRTPVGVLPASISVRKGVTSG